MKLLRQAGWISAEHAVGAGVQLALSGWLIAQLGLHGFGVWTLLLAIAYLCGIVSLGLGAALLRHVSTATTAAERGAWLHAALALFAVAAAIVAVAVALLAALMRCGADGGCAAFGVAEFEHAGAIARTAPAFALLVVLEQLDGLLVSALRAEQRYRAVAGVEIAGRLLWLSGLGAVAWLTGDVEAVMRTAPLLVLPKVAANLALLARGGVRVTLRPRIERDKVARLLHYARWQWLRAIGVQLYTVADRVVVASVLGTAAVGVYAVCVQLADPIYKIVVLVLQPLFPWAARQTALARAVRPWRWHLAGVQAAIVAGGLLWIVLAQAALPLWLGAGAAQYDAVLAWAVLGYLLLGLHVVPNYLQMGAGRVRTLAIATLAGGAGALALMAWAGQAGLVATMQARCVYGLVLFVTWPTVWRLLRVPSGERAAS